MFTQITKFLRWPLLAGYANAALKRLYHADYKTYEIYPARINKSVFGILHYPILQNISSSDAKTWRYKIFGRGFQDILKIRNGFILKAEERHENTITMHLEHKKLILLMAGLLLAVGRLIRLFL